LQRAAAPEDSCVPPAHDESDESSIDTIARFMGGDEALLARIRPATAEFLGLIRLSCGQIGTSGVLFARKAG
jgi:hypothetical protein